MNMNINPKALEAMLELCDADTLECNISLMEDSIDAIIDEDSITPEVRIYLVEAYRRLGKQFRTILNAIDKPAK